MKRYVQQRAARALALAVALSSQAGAAPGSPTGATSGAPTSVPPWAEGFRETWLEASRRGSLALSPRLSSSSLPPGASELCLAVDVTAPDYPAGDPPPLNLGIVLDHSQSMKGPLLRAAKRAIKDLVSRLGEADRVAMIRVSTDLEVFESAPLTPETRRRLLAFVDATMSGGSSDLSMGFGAAVEELEPYLEQYQANRLVLFSDGRLTHGMNDPAGLAQMARRARDDKHIHISTVAIGEEADQELMAGIAKEGWGLAEYMSDAARVPRIGKRLRMELTRRAAEEVELTLQPAPGVTLKDVLEYDEIRRGPLVRIRLHEIGAGESLRVLLRLQVDTAAPGSAPLGALELAYRDLLTATNRKATSRLSVSIKKPGRKPAQGVDTEVLTQCARAVAVRDLAWAEGISVSGDPRQVLSLLDETRAFLLRTQSAVGPRALKAELERVEAARKRLGGKTTPPHRRRRGGKG